MCILFEIYIYITKTTEALSQPNVWGSSYVETNPIEVTLIKITNQDLRDILITVNTQIGGQSMVTLLSCCDFKTTTIPLFCCFYFFYSLYSSHFHSNLSNITFPSLWANFVLPPFLFLSLYSWPSPNPFLLP